MSEYHFVTKWSVNAPVEAVWNVVEAADAWSEWWKGVIRVEKLSSGNEDGVGAIRRTVWKSALPYKLEFDTEVLRIIKHRLIEVRAFGELDGFGRWQFEEADDKTTDVRYDWTVKTTKRWMNLLAPAARPFFRWNHDKIMRWGEEGLKRRLGIGH